MSQPVVFVTRIIPEEGLAPLRAAARLDVWPDELPPDHAALCERVRGVDGLLCLLTDPVDAAVMDAAGPGLKVISQMAVGTDNIDRAAATARGIPVGHTPGVLTDATADFTWALLMAAARRVVEADAFTRAGRWQTWGPTLLAGADISGAVLGIVGLGRIGQAVARRAQGFEMQVLYHDRQRDPEAEARLGVEFAPLDDLLRAADFVTLHVPLTAETHHLISAAQFALMKPSAILVNTARGPVVDPAALADALRERRIAAAALDVTDPEPIPPDSPLLALDNLIITPHIASASIRTRGRMAAMAAENLLAGLRGERLPHCANPEVYG
ncbi:MAG: D-glycerate dehydrogenase [Anaerolineae bacterium]